MTRANRLLNKLPVEDYERLLPSLEFVRDEFERGGDLKRILLRYTQSLMTPISQTAVCNRLHTFEQRLCRWLLFSHDCLQKTRLF